MATNAQMIANRRNCLKSTGPISREGKTAVAQNAIKHGLSARQAVIASESRGEFNEYRDLFLEELNPTTPMESMLAERIVNLSWRLKRSGRIQNQTIDAMNAPDTPSALSKLKESLYKDLNKDRPDLPLGRMAIEDFSNDRVLERLLMYERRIENSLYKTIIEYQRLNLIKGLDNDYQSKSA